MFDNILSAVTLVGVCAVLASVLAAATVESPAALAGAKAPAAVAELPRVVVVGRRSHDGEIVAAATER